MTTRHKTLSTQSAEVIRHFTNLNQPGFTLTEATSLLKDSSADAVRKLMRDMVNRGLLLRLKDGLYWIIPYEQEASDYFPNVHLVVGYLVGNANYYIGYYSALELHSLITQPSMVEQVVVDRQIKPSALTIGNKQFQFIYHNKAHFFGTKNIWIDGYNKVQGSDLEKTFVDCLYKPDYGGGITEISKALFKVKDKIDYGKLLEYCKQFKAQTVIKRLGFLLELLQIDNPIIDRLQQLKTPAFTLLEPSYEKQGKLISRWSIQQNIDIEDITSPIFT
ncbi:type IV toxin-antitoxin system AbiEi family antitoxin domain-containing protein [Parafilimonas sp.]|uniref:type IV toxin-antitoxin system AbiEi family antitoxin domain-containing protein n=1 Tax=Parafilimonas sp. TaxID=1969739 RepID=UPI003F7EA199